METQNKMYEIHQIHANTDREWRGRFYKIVSIDPAIKNLAIRVEHRFPNGSTKAVLYERNNFESGTLIEILNYLESKWHLMIDPHFVIIEKQLAFNYKALRVSQHLLTFFYMKCQNNPVKTIIVEIDPKLKSKFFTSVKMNPKEVKKWAVGKAEEILVANNDLESLARMKSSKKKDDMADVVVQIEAFWKTVN
jgi:hypothetical protein